jgi:hypothetical protein
VSNFVQFHPILEGITVSRTVFAGFFQHYLLVR